MSLPSHVDANAAKAVGPLPAGHPPVKTGKVGVLLINLGTPDGTDYTSMRRYLREFLSDRRVIERPRGDLVSDPLRLVLTTRPQKVRRQLRPDLEPGEERIAAPHLSPASQAEQLTEALADLPNVVVDWAMRYGNPSTASVAHRLVEQGCDRILSFPLYPQYSATTTATVNDKALPRADEDAQAAGGAHRAALLRRAGLYRCARQLDRAAIWRRSTWSRR